MAMSVVCNFSPLALRKDHDSVENEKKDFASPIKKLKVDKDDLVGEEEHNTDSVTSLSLSDREIFDKWCKCYRRTYKDEEEEKFRFSIFQKVLNPPIPENERGRYYVGMADRTTEELEGSVAYIFESDIELMDKLDEIFTQSEKDFPELKGSIREEDNTVTSLSNREIFDKWCKYFRITYNGDEEEKFRFNIFQKALNPPIPKKERGLYFPGLADRTSEELDGLDAYVFESDIVKYMHGLDGKMLYGFTQSEKVFAELKDSAREEDNTNY
ncbi:uncharacterized protein LOC123908409 isoform X1 [Trifolium pratense]|uniref:uncharacterized protein LOC123908409 isoform X1 n=1 Tax=Trifolium pratense TaxID=57577 RepID=UPI001E697576|nr:uncharacterized protein LOC123908409 isoform X1 [Trifolium pratense]